MSTTSTQTIAHDDAPARDSSVVTTPESADTTAAPQQTSGADLQPDGPTAEEIARHNEALEKLFSHIGELSSLPSVAGRILKVASDENTGATDLMEAVADDPSLALRIMRTVNSSYFGLRHPVADLKSAISLLGFRVVRNLALTIHVSRLFEESGGYRSFTREGLWRHMVAVASTARLVAKICRQADPEEAYLAGLLHDIGIILIDQFLRQHFIKILDSVDQGMTTVDSEREELSFDHTELGSFIAEKSNFAEPIIVAIRYHHTPDEYEGPHQAMLDVVTVANYLASRQGIGSLGSKTFTVPSDQVYSRLGMKKDQLEEIWSQLEPTLDSAATLASL